MRDAIEVRGVLEGTAARLAAERLSDPGELAALRACCREAANLLPMMVDRFVRYLDLNESAPAVVKIDSGAPIGLRSPRPGTRTETGDLSGPRASRRATASLISPPQARRLAPTR